MVSLRARSLAAGQSPKTAPLIGKADFLQN
jgi:hypothetical protein